jgi:hypothetical protein
MDNIDQYYNGICAHISSLVDAITTGTDACYEVSEPLCVGGPQGQYTCRSPFNGDCEWKVDIASAGGTNAQIVVSSTAKQTGVDYTGATQSFSNLSAYDGLVINVSLNSTVPVDSEWYPVRNSEGILNVLVIAATNAAFVNIVFRQKRLSK